MVLAVPIAFALGIAGAAGIYFSSGGKDLLLVLPQEIYRIMSSFPLLAIPLFIYTGTIMAQGRGPKLTIFKMKRRKGYRRKYGHRQDYTEIRVDAIES